MSNRTLDDFNVGDRIVIVDDFEFRQHGKTGTMDADVVNGATGTVIFGSGYGYVNVDLDEGRGDLYLLTPDEIDHIKEN